jgi:hypothetical protein
MSIELGWIQGIPPLRKGLDRWSLWKYSKNIN